MILDIFRKTQSWAIKLLLILLAITFAFGFGFGISNFGSPSGVPQGTAANVNEESIPISDFYRLRDVLLRQYRRAGLPEDSIDIDVLGIQALNQLIDVKLLSQEARKLGLRISDQELSESITTNPAFQIDGKFIGSDAYRRLVEGALNETVGEFERKYREELLASKMEALINRMVVISDEELLSLYSVRNEKVNLNYLKFTPENFEGAYEPGDEEVKEYYNEHTDEFLTPELRTVEYFTLGARYFENEVSVSEDEIRAYYEANRGEFVRKDGADPKEMTPPAEEAGEAVGSRVAEEGGGLNESVIPLEEVAADIESTLVRQRASEYREEFLRNLEPQLGEKSLLELARAYGAGELRASPPFKAGELAAELPRGVTNQAFNYAQGEISVATAGEDVWLFEVKEIISPEPRALEDVRDDIENRVAQIKARELSERKAEEALKAAAKGGKPLTEIASEFGAELNETGHFTRMGRISRIDSEDVRLDAFGLTEDSPVAPKVYDVGDAFYVVVLQNRQSIDLDEFYSKRQQLRETELQQRRRRVYADWLQGLRSTAQITINEGLFNSTG